LILATLALATSAFFFAGIVVSQNATSTQYVFETKNLKRYRFPTHTNDLVMDRSLAKTSEVIIVVLEPGEAPPLHKHDDTEQIFYLKDRGRGRVCACGTWGWTVSWEAGPPQNRHGIVISG